MNLLDLLRTSANLLGLYGHVTVVSDKSDYRFRIRCVEGLPGNWPEWQILDRNYETIYTIKRLPAEEPVTEISESLKHKLEKHNVDFGSEDWKLSESSRRLLKSSFENLQKAFLTVMGE